MKNLFILAIIIAAAGSSAAQNLSKHINAKKNIAIEGYDPVSYFDKNPLEGKENITAQHAHITYQFASVENKNTFLSNPEKYLPQYGGWCAYAMGVDGSKVKVDPETYKVVDGKLYLFYNFRFTNTLPSWNEDEQNLKPKADKNWESIVTQ